MNEKKVQSRKRNQNQTQKKSRDRQAQPRNTFGNQHRSQFQAAFQIFCRRWLPVCIAALILSNLEIGWPRAVSLAMSALCAGLTVGGKAIGKTFAVCSATTIVHTVGRIICCLRYVPKKLRKKKKNKR